MGEETYETPVVAAAPWPLRPLLGKYAFQRQTNERTNEQTHIKTNIVMA